MKWAMCKGVYHINLLAAFLQSFFFWFVSRNSVDINEKVLSHCRINRFRNCYPYLAYPGNFNIFSILDCFTVVDLTLWLNSVFYRRTIHMSLIWPIGVIEMLPFGDTFPWLSRNAIIISRWKIYMRLFGKFMWKIFLIALCAKSLGYSFWCEMTHKTREWIWEETTPPLPFSFIAYYMLLIVRRI